jgi:hypothetical protein
MTCCMQSSATTTSTTLHWTAVYSVLRTTIQTVIRSISYRMARLSTTVVLEARIIPQKPSINSFSVIGFRTALENPS